MFDNSTILAFFSGMFLVTAINTVYGKDVSLNTDIHKNCNKVVVEECTEEHLSDKKEENEDIVTKPNNVESSTNKEDDAINSNVNSDNSNKVEEVAEDVKDESNTFIPVLVGRVYKMDCGVSDESIAKLENQLKMIPSVLVDDFYKRGYRLNLYSKNSKLIEDSYFSTSRKSIGITHKGVNVYKLFTEYAYYLEYYYGVSKDAKFIEVFNKEGKDINKTPKGYLIKSFQDYVLRGDKLNSSRPLTYKYFKDYFIVMGGGVVVDEIVTDEPNDGVENDVITGIESTDSADSNIEINSDIVD